MAVPANTIIRETTRQYLDSLRAAGTPKAPDVIEKELLDATNKELRVENAMRRGTLGKDADANEKNQIPLLKNLTHRQVAEVLVELHGVRRLRSSRASLEDGPVLKDDLDPLVVWVPELGIYGQGIDVVSDLIDQYNSNADDRFYKNVMLALRRAAPRISRETSMRWAPVANGDYERATGELHPFSPDRVFLSRTPVPYDPDAENPVFHNDEDGTDWDVDSGLLAIADGDEETLHQLWEVFASIVQPQVRTNRAVALFNPHGNNGKGTIIEMASSLAGEANTLNASIAALGRDSTLPLIKGKSLIVSDENATNEFVKNAEVVKSLATRDPILVNPKYEKPYNEVFEGAQVHCINAIPRFADHSESMWRRWHMIPLTARFEGRERMYIRDDYASRPETLRYILKRALEMPFSGYTRSDASNALLLSAKLENDPVRRFWSEHTDAFTWDMLPIPFLYELYKGWTARNKPSGRAVDLSSFQEALLLAVEEEAGEWSYFGGDGKKMKAASRMSAAEPMVVFYDQPGRFEMPAEWGRAIDPGKQFRNVLHREPTGAAAKVSATMLMEAETRAEAAEIMVARDEAEWRRRTIEEDGVTDPAHVADHVRIRRNGQGCAQCTAAGLRQARDDEAVARSLHLEIAMIAAQQALSDLRDRAAPKQAEPSVPAPGAETGDD